MEWFSVNYEPIIPKSHIYHRSGWKECIDHLSKLHHPDARVKLIDLVDNYYHDPTNPCINCHWIGIVHHVPSVPDSNSPMLEQLLENKRFKRDLFYCLGIFVLSPYLKFHLQRQPLLRGIPIDHCFHPTQLNVPAFDPEKFANNPDPCILFIGNQDRRLDRFQKLNTAFGKKWLPGSRRMVEEAGQSQAPMGIEILRVTDGEYDELLTKNVVMVDLYNSSANNTVIECLARNTPILVNIVGGVLDYLGEDYPLYFNDANELERKSNDNSLILKAHGYLRDMDKSNFTFERFLDSITGHPVISRAVIRVNQKYSKKNASTTGHHLVGTNVRLMPKLAHRKVKDDAGPPVAGSLVAGTQVAETRVAGPQVAEPRVAGPQVAGGQTGVGIRVPMSKIHNRSKTRVRKTVVQAQARIQANVQARVQTQAQIMVQAQAKAKVPDLIRVREKAVAHTSRLTASLLSKRMKLCQNN